MTEQMAIETIRKNHCTNNEHCTDSCMYGKEYCAYSMAIQALEEIQQYRAIGTVAELQALKEKSVAKKPIEKEHTYDWFGTQQFRVNFYCPSCNELVENDYCKCGQRLDWE